MNLFLAVISDSYEEASKKDHQEEQQVSELMALLKSDMSHD